MTTLFTPITSLSRAGRYLGRRPGERVGAGSPQGGGGGSSLPDPAFVFDYTVNVVESDGEVVSWSDTSSTVTMVPSGNPTEVTPNGIGTWRSGGADLRNNEGHVQEVLLNGPSTVVCRAWFKAATRYSSIMGGSSYPFFASASGGFDYSFSFPPTGIIEVRTKCGSGTDRHIVEAGSVIPDQVNTIVARRDETGAVDGFLNGVAFSDNTPRPFYSGDTFSTFYLAQYIFAPTCALQTLEIYDVALTNEHLALLDEQLITP